MRPTLMSSANAGKAKLVASPAAAMTIRFIVILPFDPARMSAFSQSPRMSFVRASTRRRPLLRRPPGGP